MTADTAPEHDAPGTASLADAFPEIPVPGPNIIGATGGSGTRPVARIARAGGMFVGETLNVSEDALPFGEYSDRWINVYLGSRENLPRQTCVDMTRDLAAIVAGHCADLPTDAVCWGWKEPRSIYLVPFFHTCMSNLRFLHVVRDGRDMAFSRNQQQLMKHGEAALGRRVSWRKPVRSIALWNRVNLMAADYGERVLGDRYRLVRFEDLCTDPAGCIEGIYAFFGLQGDAEAAAAEVHPPDSVGRWRDKPKRVVRRLEGEGEPALRRFGYL